MEVPVKTIGLLGGMSWESTALYYRLINERTRALLGGLHSAPIAMVSVDFAPLERLQVAGDWVGIGRQLSANAREVQAAGADVLLLCTNTMHKVADEIAAAVDIPMLYLADTTAQAIRANGHARPALLGTRFTMEEAFYRERLSSAGLSALIPDQSARDEVHCVIYQELCQGQVRAESRNAYQRVVADLANEGADCVIAGCTEITLLLSPDDCPLPLYDTAALHAQAAVSWALQ